MQQTNTYKLNLIETSDVFSPNPLNENMEKVEQAVAAEAAARASADTAEAKARADGDAAEAKARADAIAAETKARTTAVTAEANARAAADTAEANARASAINALASRVTTLEGRKFAWGSYQGSGANTPQTISLGFTPGVVLARSTSTSSTVFGMATQGCPMGGNCVTIVTGGFQVSSFLNAGGPCNYLAIG